MLIVKIYKHAIADKHPSACARYVPCRIIKRDESGMRRKHNEVQTFEQWFNVGGGQGVV